MSRVAGVLDVKRLRLLVEFSRRGTIAEVAQALNYSASAVSQQLSVLEAEAGVALLEPFGRRVRLTPEGELLVTHAHRVLTELEAASAALAAASESVTGTVRLAAFQSAVLTVVPPALIALHLDHPTLRVEVTELEPEESQPALAAGDFDVVIAEEYPHRPQPQLPGLRRENVLTDVLELVVPQQWGQRTLADMAQSPFAMEPPGTAARDWSDAICRDAGFEPDVCFTSTDLQIHLRMAKAGCRQPCCRGSPGRQDIPVWWPARFPGLPRAQCSRRPVTALPADPAYGRSSRPSRRSPDGREPTKAAKCCQHHDHEAD